MGSLLTSDSSQPKPNGSFLARSNLSWLGSTTVIWQIVMATVAMEMLNDDIVTHPRLLPILLFVSIGSSCFCFLFNMFFWGATAAERKVLTSSDGRPVLEAHVSYATRQDRLARACGDQWITSWVLGASFFLLIFLTKFYRDHGVHNFQPLETDSVRDIMNYIAIKLFQVGALAIAGITFAIGIYTGSDHFKRYVSEMSSAPGMMTNIVGGIEEEGTQVLTGVVFAHKYTS